MEERKWGKWRPRPPRRCLACRRMPRTASKNTSGMTEQTSSRLFLTSAGPLLESDAACTLPHTNMQPMHAARGMWRDAAAGNGVRRARGARKGARAGRRAEGDRAMATQRAAPVRCSAAGRLSRRRPRPPPAETVGAAQRTLLLRHRVRVLHRVHALGRHVDSLGQRVHEAALPSARRRTHARAVRRQHHARGEGGREERQKPHAAPSLRDQSPPLCGSRSERVTRCRLLPSCHRPLGLLRPPSVPSPRVPRPRRRRAVSGTGSHRVFASIHPCHSAAAAVRTGGP